MDFLVITMKLGWYNTAEHIVCRLTGVGGSFGDTVRALLPLLKHTLDQRSISSLLTGPVVADDYTIILTLLLASRCGDNDWKSKVIDNVLGLLEKAIRYLKACARQRKRGISSRLASSGKVSIFDEDSPKTPRASTVFEEYLRSKAHDLIMLDQSDLDGALKLLSKFKASCVDGGNFSLMERYELRRHRLLGGKIMRWKGDFRRDSRVSYA
jgi:hypothetical protein